MNVFELFGKIAVDSSGAMSGIDQTVGHAKKAENNLSRTFKKIGGMVAAAFSVRAIVDFGKQCTQAYASIAAEESAFAQIMGDYADTAQAKLNAVADQTGVASTRMTGAMTSLTAKFKGLGYGVEDATTLASDGLLIAADAAAFWDMSLDESMSHLNSFINGSYEGGEAIGLFANDTQMAAYAIEKGIVKDTKAWAALDEATKQATRLDYAKKMMADSGATGQAAKESQAYANVMANLKESWRQFQGVIGKPILEKIVLPAMQKLNDFMPKLTESVQNGIVWLENGFDKIKGYFEEVFTEDGINIDALPNALTNMFHGLSKSAGRLLSNFGQMLRKGWSNTVWPAIQGVAAKIGIELPKWSEIETKVKTWWENGGFAAALADACIWTLNLFGVPVEDADDVKNLVSGWWSGVKSGAESALDWVLNLFGVPVEDAEKVKETVSGWWEGVKSGAETALAWVLTLFGVPVEDADKVKETVSGWWEGVKSGAETALAWVLTLFGVPVEDADKVKETVSGWWEGVKSGAESALVWVLTLFGVPVEDADKVKETVSGWWEGVKSGAESALAWVLTLFGVPVEDADKVKETVSGWWEGVKSGAETALAWVLTLFGVPVEDADKVKETVSGWWEGVKSGAESALEWTLGLFKPPVDGEGDNSAVGIVTKWWEGIKSSIEQVCQIDLTKVNVSGIFDAAKGAYDSFIATCNGFVNDVLAAVSSNANGEVVLNKRLSGLFDAGVEAIANIVSIAGTLVADVVGAITGKEEDAKKIGGVFSDLFGVAGEVVIGIKNDAVAIFDWFANSGGAAAVGITAVAGALAKFALAHPAIMAITAIGGLIGFLEIDWENFESNYPQLAQMFKDLTGLDFTNVAGSLDKFKDSLGGIVEWFTTNETALNTLLVLLGGIAFATGHLAVGTTLVAFGGGSLYADAKKDITDEDSDSLATKVVENDAALKNAYQTGDTSDLNAWQWYQYHVGLPAAQYWENLWNELTSEPEKKENPIPAEWIHTLPEGTEGSTLPTELQYLQFRKRQDVIRDDNTDGIGGSAGGFAGMISALQSLTASVQSMAGDIPGKIAEGIGNITVTGSITTGNVVLNKAFVGEFSPILDLKLGSAGRLAGRTG